MVVQRRGFTLIYVVVITAIIALMFVAASDGLIAIKSASDAQTTYAILAQIDSGICGAAAATKACGNAASFASTIGTSQNPQRIAQLSSVIVSGNLSYHNSCGGTTATNEFVGANVTAWNANGPYIPYVVNAFSTSGLWTPFGYIRDTLMGSPSTTGISVIQIAGVTGEQAAVLDQIVDGGDGSASGKVQWNATVNDTTTINYQAYTGKKC